MSLTCPIAAAPIAGTTTTTPRWCDRPIPVLSFIFDRPKPAVIDRLHAAGTAVWVSVTTVGEAETQLDTSVDGPAATGLEIDKQGPVLGVEQIAWMWLAVHELLGRILLGYLPFEALERIAEQRTVRVGQRRSA